MDQSMKMMKMACFGSSEDVWWWWRWRHASCPEVWLKLGGGTSMRGGGGILAAAVVVRQVLPDQQHTGQYSQWLCHTLETM
jgi:hypothetical protein